MPPVSRRRQHTRPLESNGLSSQRGAQIAPVDEAPSRVRAGQRSATFRSNRRVRAKPRRTPRVQWTLSIEVKWGARRTAPSSPTITGMQSSFWEQRWAAGRIGFHRPDPHPLLLEHGATLASASRIYVPLCGKSVDLVHLRRAGHTVFGTEVVPLAIAQFFAELGETPVTTAVSPFRRHEAAGITILEGDALALQPTHLGGPVDAAYDRGSLVAVAPVTRQALADSICGVLRPGGRILLITLTYDQTKADGPPWSVSDSEVRRLFAGHGAITLLGEQPDTGSPSLRAAGITEFLERAYAIEILRA